VSEACKQGEPPAENTATLRLANGPLVAPVLCRVVSMVLARANCPMDRLDDALLVCDALSAHAPAHTSNGHLDFTITTRPGGVELRVASLVEQGALALVRDALVPGVGNVLECVTDGLHTVPASDGKGEQLVMEIGF
jgi:hypothetical protein